MTKEEIQKSSQKKVQAVTTLMKQLSLEASAERMITPEGFIKDIVYFTDTEQYPVDEPKKDNDQEIDRTLPKELQEDIEKEDKKKKNDK